MIRITGGEYRGRGIEVPRDLKTRPSQAKLRQALFNSIQMQVPEARVLDLFCGSGTLGIEALSRGAAEVVFVEKARSVTQLIEKNLRTLKVEDTRAHVLEASVEQAWAKLLAEGRPFDLILADPPYADDWERKLLEEFPWEKLLAPEGRFLLEWGRVKSQVRELPEETSFLLKVREKDYGDSVLTTYERKA